MYRPDLYRFVSACLVFIASFSLLSMQNPDLSASIKWENLIYDAGQVKHKQPLKINFNFSNNSMVPLVILSVKTSCGCTVADYPKEPIMPGKSGAISVTFDAEDIGYFHKQVSVNSNTSEGTTFLEIKGEVIK